MLAAALVLATLPAACWGSPGNIVRGRGLLQSTIPFCPAAVTEETAAEVAPPACQPGTTEYKDRRVCALNLDAAVWFAAL